MKLIQKILAMVIISGAVASAAAQGNFDYFAAPKTIVLQSPVVLAQSGTTVLNASNNAINIGRFLGDVVVDINITSNSVAGTGTNVFTIQSSPNGSNSWTTVSITAFATPTTIVTTNYYGTTNSQFILTTNNFMVPGTITYPTVASAGFSGQYVIPAPFTSNASATTIGSATYTIGFDADNQGNFIQILWTQSGSNSDFTVSAVLRGRTKGGIY